MAYFNRKNIVSILAEKPDMMSAFPENVLSHQQREGMAHIPDIALCDITMLNTPQALDALFVSARPDAVLPVVVYGGIERVKWREFDSSVVSLKKHLERTWHVHVMPPVVLGAPLFRSALCLYAGKIADQHMRLALQCAACFFYRAAACIPLCKLSSVNSIYMGGLASCCGRIRELAKSFGLLKNCKILLAGYGIELFMPAFDEIAAVDGKEADEVYEQGFECFVDVPGGPDSDPTDMRAEVLQHYFENFAIPFAANVMSRLLAGHAVDFITSARSFLPADRKKA